jgi:hypothetical protein
MTALCVSSIMNNLPIQQSERTSQFWTVMMMTHAWQAHVLSPRTRHDVEVLFPAKFDFSTRRFLLALGYFPSVSGCMDFDRRYETSSTNHHTNYRLGQLQGNLVFTILGHFSRSSDRIIKNSLSNPMSDRLIKIISPKHVELRTSITFGIFVAHAARQNLKRLSCVMSSL